MFPKPLGLFYMITFAMDQGNNERTPKFGENIF
jgi:hypothetical protein